MTHTTEELERLKDAYAEAKETYNVNRSAANLETATVAYRHYARAAVNALPELLESLKRQREAFSGPAAWLNSWAQHVGNCKGGYVCTCGLTLARTEAAAALKETTNDA